MYVGSALKNRGIQPLLNAVQQFLPGPSERQMIVDFSNPENMRKLDKNEKLCGYIFKMYQDPELGTLGFTRLYSGIMQAKSTLLNSTKDELVKVLNIYRVRANRFVSI